MATRESRHRKLGRMLMEPCGLSPHCVSVSTEPVGIDDSEDPAPGEYQHRDIQQRLSTAGAGIGNHPRNFSGVSRNLPAADSVDNGKRPV